MIKRTLLFTLLLFTLYNGFITYFGPKNKISRNQWQDNLIKAQEFIFPDSSYQNIIVGSSLSCRLPADSLKDFYNLSLSGQSIFDGLKIITHKEQLPQKVFIETNTLLREEDKSFTSSLENPILFYSRKNLLSLQEGKQPIDIASVLIEKVITKFKSFDEKKPGATSTAKSSNHFFDKAIEIKMKINSIPPDPKKVNESFLLLKKYVDFLQSKKVEVVFFEMPVNSKITNLAVPATIRNKMQLIFPSGQYKYIYQPNCSKYITTDGIHLSSEESSLYVNYFKTSLCKFKN